jgi:DNA-binding PadR family transcriptional regulator
MYELLVLSLLMDFPLHAHLIADIANHIIGPWERISRGTLSSLLRKLEDAHFIVPAHPAHVPFPTKRSSRALAISPTGRDRFFRLMLDTISNQGTYQRLFHIKALHFHLLPPEDQRYLVDHYLTYCETGLRYQTTQVREMIANPMKREYTDDTLRAVALELMALIARQWQREIEWARILCERIVPSDRLAERR